MYDLQNGDTELHLAVCVFVMMSRRVTKQIHLKIGNVDVERQNIVYDPTYIIYFLLLTEWQYNNIPCNVRPRDNEIVMQ